MCGATSEQKSLAAVQTQFYNQMIAQSQAVFGYATKIFDELQSAFAPIVAAGPNQHGFSAEETANFEREITDQTGGAYHKAADALNSELASQGGGDMPIISGANNQLRSQVAESGAAMESTERQQVLANDYATGRQNFFAASNILGESANSFNVASGMANAATGAGNAAANTDAQIAAENNSWVNAVVGALGSIGGAVASGGMKNLGDTGSFFG